MGILAGPILQRLPPPVFILLLIRPKRLPLMIFRTLTIQIYRVSLLVIEPQRTLDQPPIIIRPGKLHVVIDDYRSTLVCPDYGGNDVALGILAFGTRVIGSEFSGKIGINALRAGSRRSQIVEIVAAINIAA